MHFEAVNAEIVERIWKMTENHLEMCFRHLRDFGNNLFSQFLEIFRILLDQNGLSRLCMIDIFILQNFDSVTSIIEKNVKTCVGHNGSM